MFCCLYFHNLHINTSLIIFLLCILLNNIHISSKEKKNIVMEALGTDTKHGRCCVCMVKNKICTRKCEFAAYFPNEVYIFF